MSRIGVTMVGNLSCLPLFPRLRSSGGWKMRSAELSESAANFLAAFFPTTHKSVSETITYSNLDIRIAPKVDKPASFTAYHLGVKDSCCHVLSTSTVVALDTRLKHKSTLHHYPFEDFSYLKRVIKVLVPKTHSVTEYRRNIISEWQQRQ